MYTCTEHSVTIHSILRLWVFNLKNKQNKQEKKKKKTFLPQSTGSKSAISLIQEANPNKFVQRI